MERECGGLPQIIIKEEMDVVVSVIDESERRHTARLKTQITHHALWRGKRKLAARGKSLRNQRLLEAMLQVMDVKVMVTMKAYEIMTVSLMVTEKEILTVNAAVIMPP